MSLFKIKTQQMKNILKDGIDINSYQGNARSK